MSDAERFGWWQVPGYPPPPRRGNSWTWRDGDDRVDWSLEASTFIAPFTFVVRLTARNTPGEYEVACIVRFTGVELVHDVQRSPVDFIDLQPNTVLREIERGDWIFFALASAHRFAGQLASMLERHANSE